VHIVNIILLGIIFVFANFPSITPPIHDPVGDLFKFCAVGFMFVFWAVNYWLQYRSKKKKWYIPIGGVVLYFAVVLLVIGFVLPIIFNLFVADSIPR